MTQASGKVRWGILGAGAIAKAFIRGLAQSRTGELAAIGSRSLDKAQAFAKEMQVSAKCYGSYEELLNDSTVHAVYACGPHPVHAEWAIKTANAKKHLLLEKPFALNHAESMAIIEAVIANNVFCMEAFMYRCHPQTAKLVELIKNKAIGDVRVIQATFSFNAGFNPNGRTFNNDLAGGGIMDVGCYSVSMSRLLAGAAMGQRFADPIDVSGSAHLGETGVDEWAAGVLKFPGDIVAQVATGVRVNQENVVRVYGSEGNILVPNPWVASREGGTTAKIVIHQKGADSTEIVDTPITSFAMEIDICGDAILSGQKEAPAPAMSWDDTLGNMKTLDRWREAVRLTYNQEKPENFRKTTVANKPLKADPSKMKFGSIPNVDKKISRLVMGCDNQNTFPHAAVIFDDWFERGGNTFDTAFIYGGGKQEVLLGQWMKLRGVREQAVIISKGGHAPFCDPGSMQAQFDISLDRLKTDHVEVYMLHRDNPKVPVGEFVDVMNRWLKKGQVKAFGGSNWTTTRVDEANEYAKKNGLQGFNVISNQFSLARMVDPPWGGCLSASDPDSRAWLKKTQTAELSWSSQARGFFLPGKAAPDKKEDAELVRCWYSEDNFQRLARANELAQKKGVSAINIAAAYVLHQPFPTFALIGPRQLNETRTSVTALDVQLTEQEVKWLNLET